MKSLRIIAALACVAAVPFAAQAADGAKLYAKHCKKCHSMEAGKQGLGPSLAGIFGQQAGKQDFGKYKALKGSDIVWDDANMSAWIENPKKFIGKATTMVVKVKKADERQAIIDFMKAN
ncbi:c-type cytochrome [Magnetovibrio sp. PR-2]|uniref:c-type cytochrome n=1 Tax=Magnetovibrio sp. PR-2 TaxID=3120356 RepID=UPI002FCDFF0F